MTDPRRDDMHDAETLGGAGDGSHDAPGQTEGADAVDAHEADTVDYPAPAPRDVDDDEAPTMDGDPGRAAQGADHDAPTSDAPPPKQPTKKTATAASSSTSAVPPGFRTVDESNDDAPTMDAPKSSNSDEDDSASAALPKRIGRYRIVRLIGAGGMGAVYEAEQENPKRPVALKLMKSGIASKAAMRRFEYESQLLGRLRHPGIAQVYEAGVHDDGTGAVPYFAMEYLADARTLTDYANAQKLTTRQRLELFIKVCEAVHHGHQKGIIHRDLKPDNILVDASGQPKIIDFGVARTTDSDIAAATVQTEVGQLVGTVPYMSPEQIEADPADIDTRSDVYGLGVVLYRLLTGKLPYDLTGTPVYEATRIIREQAPLRMSTMDHALRGDVETIVLHALEKDRDRRYQSANALAQDIERYLNDEPILARPPSLMYVWTRFAKRNKLLVGGATLVFILLVGGVIGTSTGMVKATHALGISKTETRRAEAAAGFFGDMLTQTLDARRDEVSVEGKAAEATVEDYINVAVEQVDVKLAEFPEVAAYMHWKFGNGYRSLANFEKAEQEYRRALALQHEYLQSPNDEIAQTTRDLGSILWQTGRYDEAEPYFRESYQMYEQLSDGDNDELARSMDYLAADLSRLHRYDEAVGLYRTSLAMRRRISTQDIVARSMNNLAMCLRDQGEFAEAATSIEQATDITRRIRGDDHIDVAGGLTNHGSCLLSLAQMSELAGKRDEARSTLDLAVKELREALAIKQKQLRSDNTSIATTQHNLADVLLHLAPYTNNDTLAEAEQLARSGLKLQQSRFGPDHERVAATAVLLITVLDKAGDTEGAAAIRATLNADAVEKLVQEMTELYDQRRRDLGSQKPQTLLAVRQLIELYDALGRTDQAQKYRQSLHN